jgi:hypothetical protein
MAELSAVDPLAVNLSFRDNVHSAYTWPNSLPPHLLTAHSAWPPSPPGQEMGSGYPSPGGHYHHQEPIFMKQHFGRIRFWTNFLSSNYGQN